ncbi:MAG: hypothetical protein IID09_05175 [Candidatus Hydrogenedentes bacterium]|nr:hypothetical protein [Candidatus Hydrogenedentota bacterium]
MNPLLKKKLEQVQKQVGELQGVLEESREDVIQQHKEKEELLQAKWGDLKRVTTLDRIAKDYDALDEQNRAYERERKQIKERLGRVIRFTKALHNAYKP